MNGILLIDKPSGMTSHDVVARIRRILSVGVRVGHGGTLDPLATGVLPILIGSATMLSAQVMQGEKEYIAEIKLGEETDTDDAKGRVVGSGPVPEDIEAELRTVLPMFLGRIEQVPPAYSAIKRGGKKAYKAARQGQKLELGSRAVEVKELELLGVKPPLFTIRVKCSKGTYIRALARDLGWAMGTFGHITNLRRTACGPFKASEAVELNKISTGQEIMAMLRTPKI
jgi:tRNA pseudouridine55 synthase